MNDEDKGTIVVNSGSKTSVHQSAPESSPLSSAPDNENNDTAVQADQFSDTPGTSLTGQDTTPSTTPKKAKGKRRVVVKKAVRKSKWNADNILTDSKSPLASADLRSILSNPSAWDILEKEEKAEILALFPDSQHILSAGTEDARPDFASLMNDDTFRYDCAAYTENIVQGRHDPEWLEQAWAAHERRKMGDFDEYLDDKFKDEWEVELPPELKTHRKPTISKEESDVKMGGVEPVPNANDSTADICIEVDTTDKKENPNSEDRTDELETDDAVQEEPMIVAAGQENSSAMEIDGADTKEESAKGEFIMVKSNVD
ncbi:hypothetical protein HG530_009106 [Fusarium avenaceum]|nr:Asx homology domain-containing protein [Fusarium avenaceum]KAI6763126.1 hypothetical protein HG530_009106 [Fusarium avenaceum]